MTVGSTPAASRRVAVVCRASWSEKRRPAGCCTFGGLLDARDAAFTHAWLAIAACMLVSTGTALRLSSVTPVEQPRLRVREGQPRAGGV